jgi:ABC-type multidrug transport system fused ATPase/permease subunit
MPENDISKATESERAASKDAAITQLLEICSVNNIEINEHLRRAILGEELFNEAEAKAIRRETFASRENVLSALCQQQIDDIETSLREDTITKEIRTKMEQFKISGQSFEVRIKNGSYVVESEVAPSGNAAGKQHIPTVSNAGGFYRLSQSLKRLVSTGSMKATTETKTIMEGVNLVLEEGKMYLILGAPGCGKSTRKLTPTQCICSMYFIILGNNPQI